MMGPVDIICLFFFWNHRKRRQRCTFRSSA